MNKHKLLDGEIGRRSAQDSAESGNQIVTSPSKPTLKSNNPRYTEKQILNAFDKLKWENVHGVSYEASKINENWYIGRFKKRLIEKLREMYVRAK